MPNKPRRQRREIPGSCHLAETGAADPGTARRNWRGAREAVPGKIGDGGRSRYRLAGMAGAPGKLLTSPKTARPAVPGTASREQRCQLSLPP